MTRKQLALIAAVCGAVAFVAALLPWASWSIPPQFGNVSIAGVKTTTGGTEGEFKGVWVIILGLLGGFHALLVHLGKHKQVLPFLPFDERQHLFMSAALFALACILTLTDFLRDFPEQLSRGLGLWLALLATAGGAATAVLGTMKPASSTPA
jgi:hypothetical protein